VSGLAGVYCLDGRPAEVTLLRRLLDAIAHRGPDGDGAWSDGAVALGHRTLHTTPDALGEKQPLIDETGAVCLALDGRVDNRDALTAALRGRDARLRTCTDAELVLHAYTAWGEDGLARIVGDFALAIWDGRRRRLLCARDPLGIRPLFYRVDGGAFVWGSELRQLLAAPSGRPQPNDGVIGEYLSNRLVTLDETLYRGILRVPPGHLLTVEDGRIRTRRYWDADPRREVRHRDDAEYAEHFLEIFREAVRCRLRSVGPTAVFLSGGLDSSSIVGVAAALVREGRVAGDAFETYTLDFTHPAADERRWVDDVARTCGIPVHRFSPDRHALPTLADEVAALQDFPDMPTTHPWGLLYDAARARGSRAAIWGYGGDEWLAGTPTHGADLLRGLRLPALVRQVRADLRACRALGGPPVGLVDAFRWCVHPLVPEAAKRLVRRVCRRDVPPWIAPAFARRVGLQERLAPALVAPAFPTRAQREIYRQLRSGWSVAEYEMVDRFESRRSMESRHPFNDLRLIEFALALPEDQRWRGAETKVILRRAARDLLPPSVAGRRDKGDFSYLFARSIERTLAVGDDQRLRLAADGFLRHDAVTRMSRRLRDGDSRLLGPLWMILATERWYRTMIAEPVETRHGELT
jgi:asparagine synthase (glutamine-hydrolysing)